jgi:ubiquinone/menaquinone biosynthesis C-methylase UbiE
VVDIGCGRGSTTLRLARQHPTAAVVAVDQSPALLDIVRGGLTAQNRRLHLVAADFHHLPIACTSADVAVAAFCLYHSPRPELAIAEIARCLRSGGHLIVTTKSADSYRNIDTLIAEGGLDPDAPRRPSLYQTFHTGNAEHLVTAAGLHVRHRVDQEHTFRFTDLAHLAEYAATSPKYRLPAELTSQPGRLASALRHRVPDGPATTTSTVTYLVAARP